MKKKLTSVLTLKKGTELTLELACRVRKPGAAGRLQTPLGALARKVRI